MLGEARCSRVVGGLPEDLLDALLQDVLGILGDAAEILILLDEMKEL